MDLTFGKINFTGTHELSYQELVVIDERNFCPNIVIKY